MEKSFEISPEGFDGDVVTNWDVYDNEGNYVGTFETLSEAEEFVNA